MRSDVHAASGRVGWGVAVFGLVATAVVAAAELTPATLAAFERYVRLTESRIDAERSTPDAFLWADHQPAEARAAILSRLARGEVVVERLQSLDAGERIELPGGMIHHWVGTIALPGATLVETLALVQDYDRYAEIYDFHVQRSERLRADDGRFAVYLRVFMKKIVTVVLDTESDVVFEAIGDRRAFATSYATRIAEVGAADTPQEHVKPEGRDRGFLWRLNMYCAFDDRDDQTVMQCEWIGLSRSIPWLLRWVVTPLVTSVPRDLLTRTLEAARDHLAMSEADG